MGIFSFIKRGKSDSAVVAPLTVVGTSEDGTAAVVQHESEEEKPLTVSYATGWPIDVIYGYLHKNYEKQGFEDAMTKSDMAFRDLNMEIIRKKILMVFREINLNYDVKKSDIEIKLETCKAAGLLSTVSDLDKTLTIIKAHKEELEHLEDDFRNNANEASIPLKSYECGFLRGIATIALSGTSRSVTIPEITTNYSEVKASA